MRLIKNLLALVVLALGALWSLQGSGLVGGSFMTGQGKSMLQIAEDLKTGPCIRS